MIPDKSLKIFHKILNFVILVLAVVVFVLMVRLIKYEYFSNNNGKESNNNGKESNNNGKESNNTANNNNDITSLENIGSKLLNLIVPDNTNVTESNINGMETTSATVVNGELILNKVDNSSTTSVSENTNVNTNAVTNNSIFTTQSKVNKEETPDLTTQASMTGINYEYESMFRKVRNFLQYPDEQKFCPNIDDSESSFWVRLPEDYAGDHYAKFCCTSCYTLVSKEIYCGENSHGLYILDNFSVNDLAKLRELYDSTPELLEQFPFPEVKLNSLLGKPVLKFRYDEDYHTIQVIKSREELMEHERDPPISSELYVRAYKCPAVATQPVLHIVNV